ncbi:TonB-dependent receptor [Catenovulum sp. SM1970]|uniref:TonB-dependent receptor n=1 Tax=Marinifaba aquimaris TaxID=2741323 RepID=UPI001571C617|nr:TonB-dependent receptor [Marinifaba aquimaris]NTS77411.1 TonB-dependent receptor [Marinifaba aquimaris]
MNKFKPNLLTLAMMSSGLTYGSYAFAAEEQSADTENVEVQEVIQVRGIRQSILGSIDKKRYTDSVSEFVDAGDLGSLPDVSIADALGRLPGVTAVRDSGQSSQLNIRGMNGDFIQTTLNGREQASTSGYTAGSRWIAFDQYPAELINQAAVYKSPKASLVEGGVAGTVEMKTANPLMAEKDHNFKGALRLSYNDAAEDVGADENGHRVSFSYQGKFADDTFGVGLGVAVLEQPNSAYDIIGHEVKREQDYAGNGTMYRSGDGYQIRAAKGTDERVGAVATLVYQPNDNFKAQFDYFHSSFDSEDKKNGLNFEGMSKDLGGLYQLENPSFTGDYLSGGTVTNIAADGPWFEMRSEDQSTESTTDSIGLQIEYVTDKFEISVDVAHSEGEKTRLDRIASMHAYQFGSDVIDGVSVDTWQELEGQEISFQNRSGQAPIIGLNTDYTDLSHMRLGIWEQFPHKYTDEIDSFKTDFKYYLASDFITSIETGFRYSERKFTDERSTFRWGTREGQQGYVDANGNITNIKGCEFNHMNHPCQPASLDGFVKVDNVKGLQFLELDLPGIANDIFGPGNYDAQQTWEHNWTLIESGALEEEVTALYFMANFEAEVGNIPVTGNVGVRYVETDTKSIGIQQLPAGEIGDEITDDNGVTRTDYQNIKYGPEYSDTLPSINLNFQLSENDQLRVAAAKVMARPPVYQLRGGAGSWVDTANDGTSPRYNVWSKGNPNLDPFRATQLDISYEHYADDGSAYVVAAFYKDVESLIETIVYQEGEVDWSEIGIEAPEGYVEGQYQTVQNTDEGGYIRGLEFAYTTVFDNLPGIFAGLGLNANYSFTQTDVEVNGGLNLGNEMVDMPGLSEHVWSGTIFWDIGNFSTHFNARCRDDYIYDGATPGGSSKQLAEAYTVVDWQASYDFENGIDAVIQVNNLTDEANITTYGNSLATGTYKEFGRQFYFGINFSY